MTEKWGGRYLVQRFAAHLAHLLNTGDEFIEINHFALYRTLIRTLAGPPDATGCRYRDGLLGYALVAGEREPEELAERYFETVLDRGMHLARDNSVHKAHELFLAMCRRGVARGWSSARLVRSDAEDRRAIDGPPSDFSALRDRVGRLDHAVSGNNPAGTLRSRLGPLRLVVGSGSIEVPEELSVWRAVSSGPFKLGKLSPGEPFNAFCSLVIKAVENANERYGAILRLGLSPLDWGDDLTVNTAKHVSAFLSAARESGDLWNARETWDGVWDRRKVPGFRSAEEFWGSELGRALRNLQRPTRVDDGGEEFPEPDDPDKQLLDQSTFEEMLDLCRRDGVVDEFDCWFFSKLFEGETIAELARMPETARRMKPSEIPAYVAELQERVLEHVRRRLEVK